MTDDISIPDLADEFARDVGRDLDRFIADRHRSARLYPECPTNIERMRIRLLRLAVAQRLLRNPDTAQHDDGALADLIGQYAAADVRARDCLINASEDDAVAAHGAIDDFMAVAGEVAYILRDNIPDAANAMMGDEE